MSAFGGLLLTNKGRNLQAKAQAGAPLVYTRIGLGDGQLGTTPIFELNSLKNQVLSLAIGKLKIINSTTAVIGTMLNNNSITSGFYFREIGVFATDPDLGEILYCYGNAGTLAEYIPPGGSADLIEKSIDVQVLTGNASNISAVIDQSLIFETPTGAQEKSDNAEENAVRRSDTKLATHLADYLSHTGYAVASGSANAYIATLNPSLSAYAEGVSLRLKINVANTGASTVNVNGLGAKTIKKSNGNAISAGNLKAGSVYTLAYDGTSFILQGEGGEYGTATAGDVLTGTTFGTEEGLVNGTIPKKLAATFNPGTTNQTIVAGQYLSGAQTILGDSDLIAANIRAGVNIFGVIGTLDIASLGGKRVATGSAVMSSTQYSFEQFYGAAQNQVKLTVTGLGFTPKTVVIYSSTGEARTSVSKDNGVPLWSGYYNVITKSGMFPLKGHASLDANGFNLPAGQETGHTVFWMAFD